MALLQVPFMRQDASAQWLEGQKGAHCDQSVDSPQDALQE